MTNNPVIRKLEKMLRLARSQDGTPEGETAARLAARLMASHAISMAEINLDRRLDPDPIERQSFETGQSNWRRGLTNILAKHCSCRSSYWRKTMSLYGHRSDIEVVKYLYDICRRQIEQAAQAYLDSDLPSWYDRGQRRSAANNFRRSAVSGLHQKLIGIRSDLKVENPTGTALVVTRKAQVDSWVDENYTFGKGSRSDYRHSSAGYRAGRNVSLSAGVGGNSTRRLSTNS